MFAVRDYKTILYYNDIKWNKQKSNTNYLLSGVWSNKKDNLHVLELIHITHFMIFQCGMWDIITTIIF